MHLSALWSLFTERNDTLCYPRGGGDAGNGLWSCLFSAFHDRPMSTTKPLCSWGENRLCKTPSTWREFSLLFPQDLIREMKYFPPNVHHTAFTFISTIPFLMYMSLCFPVQNIRVSLVNEISFAKWVFGAGKCTTSPFSISNRSCHSNAAV